MILCILAYRPSLTGKGETIGFVELGGGYQSSDLNTYFSHLGISPVPMVSSISVDGAQNAPSGDPNSAGDADPATGYTVLIDGQSSVSGGTSAVAPLYAALFALIK